MSKSLRARDAQIAETIRKQYGDYPEVMARYKGGLNEMNTNGVTPSTAENFFAASISAANERAMRDGSQHDGVIDRHKPVEGPDVSVEGDKLRFGITNIGAIENELDRPVSRKLGDPANRIKNETNIIGKSDPVRPNASQRRLPGVAATLDDENGFDRQPC